MKHGWMIAVALLMGAPAAAQQVKVKPLADVRLRYEHVDQDGLPRQSDAITARARAGVEVAREHWSALVEGEATIAPLGDYNDGLNGRTDRPLVVDPRNLQLNRAQVRYAGDGLSATVGRQKIELLDQRFVGSSSFRQNDQTYDGVRVQLGKPTGPALDVSYVRHVLTVNGARGRGVRQDGITGDNLFAVAGVPTPVGRLSGFAFLVDQDEVIVQGYRLSSQSYGVRLAGKRTLGGGIDLSWAGSWATQSDYHRNPNRYRAGYWLAEATLARRGLSGTIGREVLGAAGGAVGGRALTSFQTPLASLFKFQGWDDKFTTTPPDGIRDLYAGGGYSWRPLKALGPVALGVTWHRFDSDRLVRHYGDEWDLLGTVTRGRTVLGLRFARYDADRLFTNTSRVWVSAEWSL